MIENLSQTQPTFLNDEEMDHPHLLQNGDAIKIGAEVLLFYEDSTAHILDDEISNLDLEETENLNHTAKALTSNQENISPSDPMPSSDNSNDVNAKYDTILEDEYHLESPSLAKIDFGIIESGRWLLKVIGGPNNGAEFHMQADNSYIIGADAHSCDIVFHDNSVSRQHAKITITSEDTLFIEDLKSRNGVFLNGNLIESKEELSIGTLVMLGTTSFVIYDREGEMHTIISHLLPSISKVLQQDSNKPEISEEQK